MRGAAAACGRRLWVRHVNEFFNTQLIWTKFHLVAPQHVDQGQCIRQCLARACRQMIEMPLSCNARMQTGLGGNKHVLARQNGGYGRNLFM